MNTYGIIDPCALKRIREENAEKVNFEHLQQMIIEKINKEWKSKSKIHQTISNNYYNLEYTIEDSYNHTGNRTIEFLNRSSGGKKLHDYNWIDIKNWLRIHIL